MTISKGSRILIGTLMVGLFLVFLVCVLAGVALHSVSVAVAQANPELQSMRIPVFLLLLGAVAVFAANLVLAEILLGRILAERIFTQPSVRILEAMSWTFLAGLVPIVALFVYTEANVGGSITQIYVIFGALIYLVAGFVFRILARLIADAARMKQEVDLTV